MPRGGTYTSPVTGSPLAQDLLLLRGPAGTGSGACPGCSGSASTPGAGGAGPALTSTEVRDTGRLGLGPQAVGQRRDHAVVVGGGSCRTPSGSVSSKQAMSVMRPSGSSAQRMRTRAPVDMASGPAASTTCSIDVSAPSSRMKARACGSLERLALTDVGDPRPGGDRRPRCRPRPSRSGVRRSAGSYSTGGHTTRPSVSLIPSTRWLTQPGQEGPDHRPGGAEEGILDDQRCAEHCGVGRLVRHDSTPWEEAPRPAGGAGSDPRTRSRFVAHRTTRDWSRRGAA